MAKIRGIVRTLEGSRNDRRVAKGRSLGPNMGRPLSKRKRKVPKKKG